MDLNTQHLLDIRAEDVSTQCSCFDTTIQTDPRENRSSSRMVQTTLLVRHLRCYNTHLHSK